VGVGGFSLLALYQWGPWRHERGIGLIRHLKVGDGFCRGSFHCDKAEDWNDLKSRVYERT